MDLYGILIIIKIFIFILIIFLILILIWYLFYTITLLQARHRGWRGIARYNTIYRPVWLYYRTNPLFRSQLMRHLIHKKIFFFKFSLNFRNKTTLSHNFIYIHIIHALFEIHNKNVLDTSTRQSLHKYKYRSIQVHAPVDTSTSNGRYKYKY